MRPPDKLTAALLERLTPLGPVSARRMFGGTGLFINGLMFGLIARDALYFKVDDSNRAAFQAAGEHPFTYATKLGTHTITSYWHCPPAVMDDAETFRQWASNAIDAAAAAARAKLKKPRRRQPVRL